MDFWRETSILTFRLLPKIDGPAARWIGDKDLAGFLFQQWTRFTRRRINVERTPPSLPPRVLLACDDNENEALASALLAKLGCSVLSASPGDHPFELLASNEVDLVLLDCRRAEKDGWEAPRRIKSMPASPGHVPVIVIGVGAKEQDRQRFLAAGMDDYLTEPLSLAALGSALLRWAPQAKSA